MYKFFWEYTGADHELKGITMTMTKTPTTFESFKAEAGDLLNQSSSLADQLNGMVKIQRSERDAMRGMPADMDGQFVSATDLKAFRDDDGGQGPDHTRLAHDWSQSEWTECCACGWSAARESGDGGSFNEILGDEMGGQAFICDPCFSADDRCRDITQPTGEKPTELDRVVSDRITDALEKFDIFRNECE